MSFHNYIEDINCSSFKLISNAFAEALESKTQIFKTFTNKSMISIFTISALLHHNGSLLFITSQKLVGQKIWKCSQAQKLITMYKPTAFLATSTQARYRKSIRIARVSDLAKANKLNLNPYFSSPIPPLGKFLPKWDMWLYVDNHCHTSL